MNNSGRKSTVFLRTFIPLILFSGLIFITCNEEIIYLDYSNFSNPCTSQFHPPSYEYQVKFTTTEVYINRVSLDINGSGAFTGDSIRIGQDNNSRTALIGGHICKDTVFTIHLDVVYTDSTDHARFKILIHQHLNNVLSGEIFYCPDFNNQCSFTQIGTLHDGSYSGDYHIYSAFDTPLFYGVIEVDALL